MKLLNLRAARRLAQRRAERSVKAGQWTVYLRTGVVCRRYAHQRRYCGWSSLCHTFDDLHGQRRSRRASALVCPGIRSSPSQSR
ncbi:hypothetical protein MRX96_020812 [Rhipicephalus microplus]